MINIFARSGSSYIVQIIGAYGKKCFNNETTNWCTAKISGGHAATLTQSHKPYILVFLDKLYLYYRHAC